MMQSSNPQARACLRSYSYPRLCRKTPPMSLTDKTAYPRSLLTLGPSTLLLLLILLSLTGCNKRVSSSDLPPHIATRAAESFLTDNTSMLRLTREAILKEPRSPRARILMAFGLARSGHGRDAVFEVAVAQQLSDSGELAQFIQPQDAPQWAANPGKLAAALKPLLNHVPY